MSYSPMAFKHMFFLLVVAITLPMISMAEEFIVGDEKGWTTGFDYQAWANRKTFEVRDKLIFKYQKGNHIVQIVDEDGFNKCTKVNKGVLFTGDDVITLSKAGRKWYTCGVKEHCMEGQKLYINVVKKKKKKKKRKTKKKKGVNSGISSANGIMVSWFPVLISAVVLMG